MTVIIKKKTPYIHYFKQPKRVGKQKHTYTKHVLTCILTHGLVKAIQWPFFSESVNEDQTVLYMWSDLGFTMNDLNIFFSPKNIEILTFFFSIGR